MDPRVPVFCRRTRHSCPAGYHPMLLVILLGYPAILQHLFVFSSTFERIHDDVENNPNLYARLMSVYRCRLCVLLPQWCGSVLRFERKFDFPWMHFSFWYPWSP